MALSGYFYGTTANSRIKPKLTWAATQNVAENYSDITVTLTYSRTNSGYTTAGNWSGTVYLGDQSQSGKKYISIGYNSDTVALTATFRVVHDDYGAWKGILRAEGKIYDPSDSTLKSTDISGEITLDTIPRAATVSASDAAIGSRATVVIGRKNADFTHSLCYRFGSLEGWIDEAGETCPEERKHAADVVNFLLPESFYGEIPQSKTGPCTLICNTYRGDTLIGSSQAVFTASADPALCAPSLTVTAQNTDPVTRLVTGREDLFVRYRSVAACQISAAAQKGATLVSVTCQGQPVEGDSYTVDPVEGETLTFIATDSRGYTTTFPLTLALLPYVLLTVNATVQRTDPTGGEAVLTLKGSCWQGSFPLLENRLTAAWAVGDETYTAELPIREDHTYYQEILLQGLDYRQSHLVSVSVADAVMTADQALTVQKGLPVFHWGEEDFQFHVPVDLPRLTVNGLPLEEYIRNIIKEI